MRTIKGNIIDLALTGDYDCLAHITNCFCTMGGGVAYQIAKNFPYAEKSDKSTQVGDKKKLGKIIIVSGSPINIINCYAQYNFGTNKRQLNYEALYRCLEEISDRVSVNSSILIPQIGCGLAGGNWNIVKNMIEEVLKYHNIIYVEYIKA
jgi:O-acetyl-ADP-ribose deacetylase (regulator of RNase III)